MFALWSYSSFPYTLGGHVNEDTYKGERVTTREYGLGSWFRPIKLLPDTQGENVLAALETLRARYRREQDALQARFDQEARDILTAADVSSDHFPRRSR